MPFDSLALVLLLRGLPTMRLNSYIIGEPPLANPANVFAKLDFLDISRNVFSISSFFMTFLLRFCWAHIPEPFGVVRQEQTVHRFRFPSEGHPDETFYAVLISS